MKYLIGIDAGTSNVKAVLFDANGKEILVHAIENEPIYIGEVRVEQNMNLLWNKVSVCIKQIVEDGPADKNDIIGIGVTAQGEGIWLVDENNEPVQDAILWCDGRATKEVDYVSSVRPELGKMIFQKTGSPPLTGTQLMLLFWMKNHRKEVLDRAHHMLFCKDWIKYHLTGEFSGDFSDGSTSLLDAETGLPSKEVFDTLGLSNYLSLIPPVKNSADTAGYLTEQMADFLGLNTGIPIIAGAIDVVSTAVGLGAVGISDVCSILGTTCANEVFKYKKDCDFGAPETRYIKHAVGDIYMNLQATMNGTPNIDWVLSQIATTNDFHEVDIMISDCQPGSGGVIYHPYISAAGERAPFYNPNAKSNFFGISAHTKRADLIHAVYEGITFSMKDCLKDIDRNAKIYLGGGGAKSEIWAQMISDVLGAQVIISSGNEFGAKGAAMMAGIASGLYQNFQDAKRECCFAKKIYHPDLKKTEMYEDLYQLYLNIRLANNDLWHQRNTFINKYFNEDI
jgi:sugar (pentulose or hexulose) kinase